ncbi:hypothetical protein B0H17DRAFT_429542 [Mycena rosella]|uniref:Uncharacterized protein n=1 Tax=Mycena rosella TaxID=1033263 RepID=A0AAD7CH77_MYCRO|nr:hypothetical protein B0H17DRAFT_429542 [Mycena rosella]
MTGFRIHNRSNEIVFCAITNKTNPGGNPAWFELQPSANDEWSRAGWEDVSFKDKNNTRRKALWINRGGPALVYFDGFDKDLTIYNDYRPDPGFTVNNFSSRTIMCFISGSSRGDSSWYKIAPGESDTWKRTGWEAISVKSEDGSERVGAFSTTTAAEPRLISMALMKILSSTKLPRILSLTSTTRKPSSSRIVVTPLQIPEPPSLEV